MLGGIAVDSFIRATVDGEVGLAVSTEIELFEFDRAFDRAFEDTGRDLSSLPEDNERAADVDGDDFAFGHEDEIHEGAGRMRGKRLLWGL